MAKKEQGDGFWGRFIITSVVVIWVALVGGNWAGHFVLTKMTKGQEAAAEEMNLPTPRPKPWRTAEPSLQRELDEQRMGLTGEGAQKPATLVTATPVPEGSPAQKAEKPEKAQASPAAEKPPGSSAVKLPAEKPEETPAAPPATPEGRPAAEKPQAEKPASPNEPPAPTPAAEGGSYQLQFGSFASEENAKALVQRLSAEGQEAAVEAVETDQGTVYRVSGGDYGDEKAAQAQADRLRGSGIDAFVRR